MKIAGPLLAESKRVRRKVKKHKAKALAVTLGVTDANLAGTRLVLNIKVM